MIDTKIACQCGNRFKFGMELVNGRAPDGLACPTCGAPATPACNALVDFLAGREVPPLGVGSRPLKEIRVVCACGARYKFDLELAEKEMPGAVTCPGCQADLTAAANEEIRGYIAKHPLNAAAPAAAPAPAVPTPAAPATAPVPDPAPGVAPVAPTAPPPAAALPVLPPRVATTAATTAPDATPASPAPPAPVPPSDAATAATKPPASAAPAPAPPATTPPAATPPPAGAPVEPGALATPIEDPFGPAPATKSSGPNLKPLEVPRPNRPPPGSRPATPPAGSKPATPAPAAPGAKPAAGKPDAAKPGTKATAKPVAKAVSREPNFNLGVGGAVGGAIIGAIIWFVLLKTTPMTASWMAVVVGLLSGGAARLLGRGRSANLGKISCVSAAVAIGLMIWMGMLRFSDRQAEKMLDTQYQQAVADAQMAIKADDTQLKAYIARTRPSADLEGNLITAADIQQFRATELPKLKDRAAGSAADKAKFYSDRIAAYRSAQDWADVWEQTFGIFGLLLALAGIMAPAKIAGE